MSKLAIVALCTLLLSATAGCGPSQAQLDAGVKCLEACRLAYMTCIETQACVDIDGQVTTCEGQCGDKQVQCNEACQDN